MKPSLLLAHFLTVAIALGTTAHARYVEKMDPDGLTKNACTDFGLVDDGAKANLSEVLQKAIDGVAAAGGGRLILPKANYVKNIHAVFGMEAQVKSHAMLSIPKEYYGDLDLRWEDKFFEAPSIGAVRDYSGDHFHIDIENVTMEGFKHNADKPILTLADQPEGKWHHALREWKARSEK